MSRVKNIFGHSIIFFQTVQVPKNLNFQGNDKKNGKIATNSRALFSNSLSIFPGGSRPPYAHSTNAFSFVYRYIVYGGKRVVV